MIPGDIGRELGERAAGTWRAAPGHGPGIYATSLPFALARATGQPPGDVARALAARLRRTAWITAASVTGGGYLTVTVTREALAALAVRVPAAGPACASSDALAGTLIAAPPVTDPATWDEAWQHVAAQVTARLAAAAGATIAEARTRDEPRGKAAPGNSSDLGGLRAIYARNPPRSSAPAGAGRGEAVRYALARARRSGAVQADAGRYVQNNFSSPYFTVRYAHASAASVLRWAADLGRGRGRPGEFQAGRLGQPAELELLSAMSWLPERAAAAARRRRPDAFARYLEGLAEAWLNCREQCPALPFGGRAAPADESAVAARLWLAAAAQTALETGLGLLGVSAPERL